MSNNQEYKHKIFEQLVTIGKSLDLSQKQHKLAQKIYNEVGEWLASGEYCILGGKKKQCFKDGKIYSQGSIKLETVVKPLGKNGFDIDLVFFTPNISSENITPKLLKELIGARLKEHKEYKEILKETNRGWCLNYNKKSFHLDITPSLDKQDEPHNSSELVADSKLEKYMPSNPKGYNEWFNDSSIKIPMFKNTQNLFQSELTTESLVARDSMAEIEDIPEHEPSKLLLKRFVQIFKRQRDIMFEGKDDAPISVIITTLATKSYLYCIENFDYDNEYDLMLDTLRYMTKSNFIEKRGSNYWIENPTISDENFAEKWNQKLIKKKNFDHWHLTCSNFFNKFHIDMGQNVFLDSIEEGFGKNPAKTIREAYLKKVENSRKSGLISATTLGSIATSAKANTFFGE